MNRNFRAFTVGPDESGQSWQVTFVWLQTGISIRHADTVDVKFRIDQGDGAEEKVIALPHPDLLALSARHQRPLTDPWCMKLAALHLEQMILTGDDMDKTLVTLSPSDLERCERALESAPAR